MGFNTEQICLIILIFKVCVKGINKSIMKEECITFAQMNYKLKEGINDTLFLIPISCTK